MIDPFYFNNFSNAKHKNNSKTINIMVIDLSSVFNNFNQGIVEPGYVITNALLRHITQCLLYKPVLNRNPAYFGDLIEHLIDTMLELDQLKTTVIPNYDSMSLLLECLDEAIETKLKTYIDPNENINPDNLVFYHWLGNDTIILVEDEEDTDS